MCGIDIGTARHGTAWHGTPRHRFGTAQHDRCSRRLLFLLHCPGKGFWLFGVGRALLFFLSSYLSFSFFSILIPLFSTFLFSSLLLFSSRGLPVLRLFRG